MGRMPTDPLPPSSTPLSPPPLPPNVRPPVPGWLWLLFGLGMVPVGAVLCLANFVGNSGSPAQLGLTGALAGLVCGLPLLGGLALASRFFGGTGARIAGGVMFAGLLLVGLGAVGFAGCICLMGTPNFH